MTNLEPAAILDAVLAEYRPFGNSDYIHEQVEVCYTRRLRKIAACLPVAGDVVKALSQVDQYHRYRVLGDTVVRCVIQQALRQVVTGAEYGLPLDKCEQVFQATVRHLEKGDRCGPLEAGVVRPHRLGSESYHGWIWTEDHADDIFGQAFRYVVQQNYGESLCTADAKKVAMLQKGARLLRELLPLSSRSALSHAPVVAVFAPVGQWQGVASSSAFRVSGTIFLNHELLHNPWWAAEYIYHESLHQKLHDFRHGHSLLVQDSLPESDSSMAKRAGLSSPWNSPGTGMANYWDTHRAVSAFHVYVHLALLCTLAEQRAPELEETYGPLDGAHPAMTPAHVAFERAHYLSEQIKQSCWPELGPAGQVLIEWLTSILDTLDPSPPPQGSYIHLFLHRYMTEAHKIRRYERGTALTRQLNELIRTEISSTRRVLSSMNANIELIRFNAALEHLSNDDPHRRFSEIRRLIADTLLGVSSDGYRLTSLTPAPTTPDQIVRDMIENSSRKLALFQNGP